MSNFWGRFFKVKKGVVDNEQKEKSSRPEEVTQRTQLDWVPKTPKVENSTKGIIID